MTMTLRRYLHIHTDSQVLDCSSGPAFLRPRLLEGVGLPLTVELSGDASGLLRQWPLPDAAAFSLEITRGGYAVRDADDKEIPPAYAAPQSDDENAAPRLTLRLSATDPDTGAGHSAYVLVLPDAHARRRWAAKRRGLLAKHAPDAKKQKSGNRREPCIHITARNIVPHDAVSNFALGLAGALRQTGRDIRLYAHDTSPDYAGLVAPVGSLPQAVRPEDILFCNYSITDEFFPRLAALPCARKILYYHNVTPGEWFRPCAPAFADRLDEARTQYPDFARFDAVLANSRFSLAAALPYARAGSACLAHPPFLSLRRLAVRDKKPAPPPSPRTLLWVGRLAPHKRPDLAIALFAELSQRNPEARLVFAGGGLRDFPAFQAVIEDRLAALPEAARANVTFQENLSDRRLARLYRSASLLLCTSAHEGYCLPLAEAAAFGLPVAAMPQPAVLETLNGGGLILDEDPKTAARQIAALWEKDSEAARNAALPNIQEPRVAELLRTITGGPACLL